VATETSLTAGLAGRYASALYELAHDAGALDQVGAELLELKKIIAGDPAAPDSARLRQAIESPLIPRAQQARAMAAVVERMQLADITRRFVGVVARNRRLAALPEIIEAFHTILATRRGEITAEVTSARPLSQAQVSALAGAIPGAAGRKVRLVLKVDPKLLGGLRVKMGSRLVDASLASKLTRLQLAMKGTA
jgi:F-type H+-transporting ATPase subunit delta